MSITIKKIAELAGVSRGTVDRVLNNRGGVKQEVADRILQIAKEFDYTPNIVARALAEKKTNKKIGVILNAEDNPFYIDVINGIKNEEDEIKDFGISLVMKTTKGYTIDKQLELIDEIIKEGVDGLIISPINSKRIAGKLNELDEKGIPIVNINIDIEGTNRLAYVGSDYEQTGRVAAGIFGLLGNSLPKNIGIITGSNLVLGHTLRISGFKDCLKNDYPNSKVADVWENNDNDANSYIVTTQLLKKHPEIDGIFFCAAGIEGGLRAISDRGLLNSLDIVTVDLTEIVKKHLQDGNIAATICQDPFRQGSESVRVMFDYIMKSHAPKSNKIIMDTQIKMKYNI